MAEYVKKIDLLSAAVEVEYLGRPRMMVSAAKIGNIPAIEVVRCKECKWQYECNNTIQITHRDGNNMSLKFVPIDFCSNGEAK